MDQRQSDGLRDGVSPAPAATPESLMMAAMMQQFQVVMLANAQPVHDQVQALVASQALAHAQTQAQFIAAIGTLGSEVVESAAELRRERSPSRSSSSVSSRKSAVSALRDSCVYTLQ